MIKEKLHNDSLSFYPLTKDRWKGIEKLFSKNSTCAECWCMWWKLNRKQFDKQKGDENKKAFRKSINNSIPGIIGYYGDIPAGWCAIEPRENFPTLEKSRLLKRIDDKPVWSIVCFYIAREFRKNNLSVELIKASIKYAKKNKAKIIEGYPVEIKSGKMRDSDAYHGLASAFLKTGFKEVARNSEKRPIMRYYI